MKQLYKYKLNGQIVECEHLCQGKPCSSGTVVKQGKPYGQPVGYYSNSWVNFESRAEWIPVNSIDD